AHEGKGLAYLRRSPGTGQIIQFRKDEQVLVACEIAIRREGLRYITNAPPYCHLLVDHIETGYGRTARGRRQERGQHFDDRALASPIGTKQAKDFTCVHCKAHVIDCSKVAE